MPRLFPVIAIVKLFQFCLSIVVVVAPLLTLSWNLLINRQSHSSGTLANMYFLNGGFVIENALCRPPRVKQSTLRTCRLFVQRSWSTSWTRSNKVLVSTRNLLPLALRQLLSSHIRGTSLYKGGSTLLGLGTRHHDDC